MEYLRLALRYVHLVGFALLLGAWTVQFLAGRFRITIPRVAPGDSPPMQPAQAMDKAHG